MKIDITFKDATQEQVIALLNKLNEPSAQLELPIVTGSKYGVVVNPTDADAVVRNATDDIPMDASNDASVDKRGLPWDERIHSNNRQMTQSGEWRRKRGVPDALVEQVEAELLSGQQNVQAAASPSLVLPEDMVMPHSSQPAAAPAPSIPAEPTVYTFTNLMNIISSLMGSGNIDPNYVNTITQRINQAYAAHGVQIGAIVDIMQNPQMIEYAFSLLRVDGKIQ